VAGSEFEIFGAEIRKAREPNSRLHRGTESGRDEEDRRVRTGSLRRSNSARSLAEAARGLSLTCAQSMCANCPLFFGV